MTNYKTKTTRRDILKVGLTSAGALACGKERNGSVLGNDNDAPEFIDAHVHVWTPDTQQYPLAAGFTKNGMRPASYTPEQLFADSRPHGVARVVLIQMSFYGYDNSYMLDMMDEHAGVFSGVAVIDPNDRPCQRMQELAARGVRGFRIRPGGQDPNTWLDGEGMKAMWKCGADEGLAMCHLIDAKYLPSVDRMCQTFPSTPVVVDHFARIGINGMISQDNLDGLCRLSRFRTVCVKLSAFYALGEKCAPYHDLAPMVKRLLECFGPQRLMWASDCPFQVQGEHTYAASIDLIRSGLGFLSRDDREWLLWKTANRIFFA